MVDRMKIFLTSSLITMQNLVAVKSHAVCAREVTKIFRDIGALLLGDGGAVDAMETRYITTWLSYQTSSLQVLGWPGSETWSTL